MAEGLGGLVRATEAFYRRDEAALRRITAEEQQLRARLDALETGAREAVLSDGAMRAVGADQAWQDWARRYRAALNRDLAHVLARKENALAALRRSFGRNAAMASLLEQQRETARQTRLAKREAALLDSLAAAGLRPPGERSR